MKRILLSAVLLSSIGAYAQVGINTAEPTATLDVNGDVRVRRLAEEKNPKKVLTVDGNNVLKWSSAKVGLDGGTAGGFGYAGKQGKRYECNERYNGKVLYVMSGALVCESENRWSTKWVYEGLLVDNNGGPVYTYASLKNSWWESGRIAETATGNSVRYTPVLYVIDDSQYRK